MTQQPRPESFLPVAASVAGAASTKQILLDTRDVHDAHVCGYDGPCDPTEDCEGLIVTVETGRVLSVLLQTGQGPAELLGVAEIKQARDALNAALKLAGA